MATYRRRGSQSAADTAARANQQTQQARRDYNQAYYQTQQQGAQLGQAANQAVQQVQGQENFERQQTEKERATQKQEQLSQERINVDAASKGLVPDDRMGQLQQEMEKGRRQKQADKGLELVGTEASRTYRPSEEAVAMAKSKAEREQFKAETDRMRVIEYRRQNEIALARAMAKGDAESQANALKALQKEFKDSASLFEKIKSGKASASQVYEFSQKTGMADMPDAGIRQELQGPEVPPDGRVADAVGAYMGKALMQAIASGKGHLPEDMSKVPMDSETFANFQQHATGFRDLLKSMPGMGQLMAIKSLDERNRIVNQFAAQAVLDGIPPPVGLMQAEGAPPSAGGQPAMAPEGQPQQPPEVVPDEQPPAAPGAPGAPGSPGSPAGFDYSKYGTYTR